MKVTVIGFSIEGEDLARYFVAQGDEVTVSTLRVPESMAHVQEELMGRGVTFRVGENSPEDVAGADLVCVSQGVPLGIAAVVAAREAGTPVRSMTSLFFEKYPGPIVGITGSSGKTTTTALVDAMFTAAGREHVTGGNIGVGLMGLLGGAKATTPAVLEVSHTQLQLLERSPEVAALTNMTPNHLDQFTWEEYVALKRRIFEFQPPGAACVFNADDPVSRELAPTAPGDVLLFSIGGDHGMNGAFVKEGLVCMRRDGRSYRALQVSDIPLRGQHNVANVAAATAVASACGVDAGCGGASGHSVQAAAASVGTGGDGERRGLFQRQHRDGAGAHAGGAAVVRGAGGPSAGRSREATAVGADADRGQAVVPGGGVLRRGGGDAGGRGGGCGAGGDAGRDGGGGGGSSFEVGAGG